MKVGNYEFALKGIKFFEAGSQETNCFVATMYINGKRVAECKNEGHGGNTFIRFYPECRALENEVETYLKAQPKIMPDGYDFEIDFNLEYIADDLFQKWLKEKEEKKMRKKMETKLIFDKSKYVYVEIGWRKRTIADLLKDEKGRNAIRKAVAEQTAQGHKLRNDNIPDELLP